MWLIILLEDDNIKFAKSTIECTSYKSFIEIFISKSFSILYERSIIPIESRPMLNKSSVVLIFTLGTIVEIISHNFCSVSFCGKTISLENCSKLNFNDFLSIFPFGVVGKLSKCIKCVGIIYVGSLFSKCSFNLLILISCFEV